MTNSRRTIADLRPGDHVCQLYETEEEGWAVLVPFLRQGLTRGEKVIHVAGGPDSEAVLEGLRNREFDPQPYLDSGQLAIYTSSDVHARVGTFDLDRLLHLAREQVTQALEEGYTALRAAGEMTWALQEVAASGRLLEYETKVNDFLASNRCLALCQYDRRRFEPGVLLDLLRAHPTVLIGTELCDNFYHIPPRELLGPNAARVELQLWLEHLVGHKQSTERAAKDALERDLTARVYEAISQGAEMEEIVRLVAEGTRALFDADAATLYFLDDGGKRLLTPVHPLMDEQTRQKIEELTGIRISHAPLSLVEGGYFWKVINERQTLLIADPREIETLLAEVLTEYPTLEAQVHSIARPLGYHSVLAAPVVIGGRPVGVMGLASRTSLDEDDRDRFERLAAQMSLAVERAQARKREHRLLENLSLVWDIGRRARGILDVEVLLQDTAEAIYRYFGYHGIEIDLVDPEKGELVVAAIAGIYEDRPPVRTRRAISRERGIMDWVALHGQTLLVNDVSKEPRYVALFPQTRSELCVPIGHEGEVIGVLNVESASPNAFDEASVVAMESLADHLAAAIENARLYEEQQHRAEEATLLLEIANAINSTLRLTNILKKVAVRAARACKADRCTILLLDRRGEAVVPVMSQLASGHLDRKMWRRFKSLRRPWRIADSAEVQQTVQKRCPLFIPNALDSSLPRPFVEPFEVGSVLLVPLVSRKQVIGLMALDRAEADRPFSDKQVDLAVTIGAQAAMAIANASLYEEVQKRLIREQRLTELAHTLGGEIELRTIIPRLLPVLVKLTGADAGTVALLDPERNVVTYPYNYNLPGPLTGTEVPADTGLAGHVMRVRQPVLLDDYREHPDALQPWVEAGVRSMLGIPLVAGDEIVGALGLFSLGEVHPFEPEAVTIAEAAGRLAAVAIQRAHLFEAEQRRRREAETLREAALALTTSLEPDQVIDHILAQLQEVVPYDSASVQLLREGRLEIVGGRGFPNLEELVGITFDPDREDNPNHHVLRSRAPFIVDDASAEYAGFRRAPHAPAKIRSWLGVPMLVGERLIGMIALDKREPGFYTAAHARLAEAFAAQAAVALENARLYRELRDYADRLEERVQERTTELRQERERIQAILDAAGQGVIVTDENGAIQYMNRAAEAITGFSADEVIGQHPKTWYGGQQPVRSYAHMAQTITAGEVWRGEMVLRRKDGSLYDAEFTIAPIPGEGDRPTGFVGILEDITPLKELDRLKTQFISDAAHELRTPVTTIKLYVSLLQREGQPEKRADYIKLLTQETDMMAQLVEDLLDLSRMEAGVAAFNPEPLDLNEVAREVVDRHVERAGQGGLTLRFEPAPHLPEVLADRDQIERMLTNLVVNAINYTPSGGLVTVRTAAAGGAVEVSVADTGHGIPAEEQERIFERFYRGSTARETRVAGTGLGLAIVREIVNMHDGEIAVESEMGRGSTFTVRLPAHPSSSVNSQAHQ